MFYEILDKPRRDLLPNFSKLKDSFYLAGGTALALYLGHRDSIDFDFFSPIEFSTAVLFSQLEEILKGHSLLRIQEEKNTLTLLVNSEIRISFFYYSAPLLEPLLDEENLKIASIIDIASMKLSAIVSRSVNKDYVDLYYILQSISLNKLLKQVKVKLPSLDENLILKSLVYFEDMQIEPLSFQQDKKVPMETVKYFLVQQVKEYNRRQLSAPQGT